MNQDVITIAKKVNVCYIVIGLLFVIAFCWFCRKDVPDYGAGVDSIRTEITATENGNIQLQGRIGSADTGAENVSESISRAETSAERIAENLDRAEQLNRECQQILARVRNRSVSQ